MAFTLGALPVTARFKPVVKLRIVAALDSCVPSSSTATPAVALTIEFASIVTPERIKSVPSKRMCLFDFPNTIFPPVRSIKAPASEPEGAAFASGILPPFKVPAVTAPKLALKAARLLTSISVAVIASAAILSVVIASAASLTVVIAFAPISSAVTAPAASLSVVTASAAISLAVIAFAAISFAVIVFATILSAVTVPCTSKSPSITSTCSVQLFDPA